MHTCKVYVDTRNIWSYKYTILSQRIKNNSFAKIKHLDKVICKELQKCWQTDTEMEPHTCQHEKGLKPTMKVNRAGAIDVETM